MPIAASGSFYMCNLSIQMGRNEMMGPDPGLWLMDDGLLLRWIQLVWAVGCRAVLNFSFDEH